MANNRQEYGLRWFRAAGGGKSAPVPEEHFVESAQSFDVNGGASNVQLGYGDVVRMEATGGLHLCDGTEGTADPPYGVVLGVHPYWDGTVMVKGKTLPSDTTYGTNLARQSKLDVVPIEDGIWECDCDDTSIGTTLAAYQAAVGLNVDLIHDVTSTNTRPTPRIDASTAATTNTLHYRIVAVSPTVHNQDFSGLYVKLLIRANIPQSPRGTLTGI